jgi:hypothetical protein
MTKLEMVEKIREYMRREVLAIGTIKEETDKRWPIKEAPIWRLTEEEIKEKYKNYGIL